MILQAFNKYRIFSCNFIFFCFLKFISINIFLNCFYFVFEIVCAIWCIVVSYVSMQATTQNGYFKNCDYYARLDANEGTSVINPGGFISILGYFGYLGFYEPGSSCRYFIESPHNYVIRLYCHINVAVTVKSNFANYCFRREKLKKNKIFAQGEGNNCQTEQFRVLDDGTNQILERGTYFCGKGPITVESRTNFITFGMPF